MEMLEYLIEIEPLLRIMLYLNQIINLLREPFLKYENIIMHTCKNLV